MGGFAWVTLATNDSYSLGALVLAHSLKQLGTAHQLAVLVTPGVTGRMREKLASIFDVVQEVDILNSKDEANLKLLQRPELGITFTKLHCWRLTQFDKCVFLDADTLVLQNCDELFERDEFSAAPDVGWPDCFNSGVFVYKPSNDTYENLIKFALEKGSFDGGDQGLLNLYFSDWAHKDISKHLPFIYNMCSTASYSYLPAFKQFGDKVKIVHFIGSSKPWLQYFDSETCQVHPSPGLQHLSVVLQRWWNIFCSLIHPNLSSEMARSGYTNVHSYSYEIQSPSYNPPVIHDSEYFHEIANFENSSEPVNVWDPWDDYKTETDTQSEAQLAQEENVFKEEPKIIESHDKNVQNVNDVVFYISEPQHHDPNSQQEQQKQQQPPLPPPSPPVAFPQQHITSTLNPEPLKKQTSEKHHEIIKPNDNPTIPNPAPQQKSESTILASTLHEKDQEATDVDAGLAGALAQVTLGAPRSPGQSALEDHLRRQGWEVGNIDYLGVDSFDNIWKKICQTLASAPPPSTELQKTREPTPPSAPQLEPIVAPAKIETQKPEETQKDTSLKPVESSGKCVSEEVDQVKIQAEQIQSSPAAVVKDVEKTTAEPKETPKPAESPQSQPEPSESPKVEQTTTEQSAHKSVEPSQVQTEPAEPPKDEPKPQPSEPPKESPVPVEQPKLVEPVKDVVPQPVESAADDVQKPAETAADIQKLAEPTVDVPKKPQADIEKSVEPPTETPKPVVEAESIKTVPEPAESPKSETKSTETQKDEPPKLVELPKETALQDVKGDPPKSESEHKSDGIPKEASKSTECTKDAAKPTESPKEPTKSPEPIEPPTPKGECKPAEPVKDDQKPKEVSAPLPIGSPESSASVTPISDIKTPSTPPQECPLPKEPPKEPEKATETKDQTAAAKQPEPIAKSASEELKTPQEAQKKETAKSTKPTKDTKKTEPVTPQQKTASETSTSGGETATGPTPPPRKGSGGAKKSKAKK